MEKTNDCYYVYQLRECTSNLPFYIGKGKGRRCKDHFKASVINKIPSSNPYLYCKIRSLLKNNTPPIIEKLYEDLPEYQALDLEKMLIDHYKNKYSGNKDGILLNIDNRRGLIQQYPKPWSEDRKIKFKEFHKNTRLSITEEILIDLYIDKNLTRKEISEIYHCSEVLIKKRLNEYGIKKPRNKINEKKKLPMINMVCAYCHNNFTDSGERGIGGKYERKYCSQKCSKLGIVGQVRQKLPRISIEFECKYCGKLYTVISTSITKKIMSRQFCSIECANTSRRKSCG